MSEETRVLEVPPQLEVGTWWRIRGRHGAPRPGTTWQKLAHVCPLARAGYPHGVVYLLVPGAHDARKVDDWTHSIQLQDFLRDYEVNEETWALTHRGAPRTLATDAVDRHGDVVTLKRAIEQLTDAARENAWPAFVSLSAQAQRVPALLRDLEQAQKDAQARARELDDVRTRIGQLVEEVNAWANASGLYRVGDLESVTPEALRERVAALEAALAEAKAEEAKAEGIAQRAQNACDAAEARVRELEETLARMKAGDKARAEFLASQPPPAPALGVDLDALSSVYYGAHLAEAQRYREENGRRGWKDAAHRAALAAVVAHLSPTPPPGLREAVGKVGAWVRGLLSGLVATDVPAPVRLGKDGPTLTPDDLRALAAYDATGGEDWGPKMQDDLRAVLTLAQTGEAGDHQTPLGARAVAAVRALHEDAAKYRAAVDLLQAMKSPDGFSDALRKLPDGGAIPDVPFRQWAGIVTWFGDYLGLTLDTPPSGPGGGERSQEEVDSDFAQWQAEQPTRARIAPTPTPEVPPLVEPPPDTSAMGTEYSQGFSDGWVKRGARMRQAMEADAAPQLPPAAPLNSDSEPE